MFAVDQLQYFLLIMLSGFKRNTSMLSSFQHLDCAAHKDEEVMYLRTIPVDVPGAAI